MESLLPGSPALLWSTTASRERELVASWSAPESWETGRPHPGRGRYLIKTGGRLGIPGEMTLTRSELELYDTDHAIAMR